MPEVSLKDILINARQESHRMRHFFLGVEHLFVGMLEIRGGLLSGILEDYGYTPEYVLDALRRRTGKGGPHRLWAGMPNTPRADVVLSIANDLALDENREESNERDILRAIFEEGDSIPLRVLRRLGLDTGEINEAARTRPVGTGSQQSYIQIDFGSDYDDNLQLDKENLFLLRRMFHGYSQVRVERHLTGGYSQALLLVVTPIQADKREVSAVVVKMDHSDYILDEAQRYETYVKNTLPPLTARLEDRPTAPDTSVLAGIKYTFVSGNGTVPHDLRAIIHQWEPERIANWLRDELYESFGKTWWRQRRDFRFQVYTEYDWLLPPMLTLEEVKTELHPDSSRVVVIREPVKRSRLKDLEYGSMVLVDNFAVQRVYPDRNAIQIAVGRGPQAAKRAYKIEVRGVDLERNTYFRGEVIERIFGHVFKTRNEVLMHQIKALHPTFDILQDKLPGMDETHKLPNPIVAYEQLLDNHVNGSFSTIHGDLHLGNILVGPNESPFLIDFAQTRDGHTLFDWACLETSLLSELVLPRVGDDWESWEAAYAVLRYIAALNAGEDYPNDGMDAVAEALICIIAVRNIVSECLARPDKWSEYYTALALCALRAVGWDTMSLGGRRLMYLLSALSMYELENRPRSTTGSKDSMGQEVTPFDDSFPPTQNDDGDVNG